MKGEHYGIQGKNRAHPREKFVVGHSRGSVMGALISGGVAALLLIAAGVCYVSSRSDPSEGLEFASIILWSAGFTAWVYTCFLV